MIITAAAGIFSLPIVAASSASCFRGLGLEESHMTTEGALPLPLACMQKPSRHESGNARAVLAAGTIIAHR